MSISYAVSQEFSPRLALWMTARFVYRAGVVVGNVCGVAASMVLLAYYIVEMLAVMAWKGKPSVETLAMVAKALALATLPAAGMALVFLAPMVVVTAGIIAAYAVVTMPHAK